MTYMSKWNMTLYLSSLNLLTIIQQVITKIFIIPLLIIFMKILP